MMNGKTILEVIKNNKKQIIKKGLIVGGTIAGLVLVGRFVTKDSNSEELDLEDGDTFEDAPDSETTEE